LDSVAWLSKLGNSFGYNGQASRSGDDGRDRCIAHQQHTIISNQTLYDHMLLIMRYMLRWVGEKANMLSAKILIARQTSAQFGVIGAV
jgi:hypothetical protein